MTCLAQRNSSPHLQALAIAFDNWPLHPTESQQVSFFTNLKLSPRQLFTT